MQPDQPSRRHFLTGFLAALAGSLLPGREPVPARSPQPVLHPAILGPAAGLATHSTYECLGRLTVVEPPHARSIARVGSVTTFTYG